MYEIFTENHTTKTVSSIEYHSREAALETLLTDALADYRRGKHVALYGGPDGTSAGYTVSHSEFSDPYLTRCIYAV